MVPDQDNSDQDLERSIRSLFQEIGGYFGGNGAGSEKRRVVLGETTEKRVRMIAAGFDTLELRPGFETLAGAEEAIGKLQDVFERVGIPAEISRACVMPRQWGADKNMPALRVRVAVSEAGLKQLEDAVMMLAHSHE